MKEESLLLLSDLQKLINQVVLIDYIIIILGGEKMYNLNESGFIKLQGDYSVALVSANKVGCWSCQSCQCNVNKPCQTCQSCQSCNISC